ncbi:AAA family ATPase [Haliangium sp.]|uniref:AAA family ATPase n=1 Tax=Haliangium sp. TaxID=2663208 RepID=UPI003D0A6969
MPLSLPIGIDDFRRLREGGHTYVDKTSLICELLDDPGSQVLLLPRPRRFGKSLNLSTLRYYFERSDEDLSGLFEGLTVWEAGEPYRSHFQRYPVIYLTFKDIKPDTAEDFWADIEILIQDLFSHHRHVLDSGTLSEVQARRYRAILAGEATPALQRRALKELATVLHQAYGERAMVFIDEYDAPIHSAYVRGFAPEVLGFFRAFLGGGLKGNPHLGRAVLTGILRIARESIFSGLNNLAVCSLLEHRFSSAFGFTEDETAGLLAQAGRSGELSEVQDWYNGYRFGERVIYNPWSVLSYIHWGGEPKPYWLGTSANELIEEVLGAHATRLQPRFEALMAEGGVDQVVDENVSLDDIEHSERALWSLLLFSGYLKAEKCGRTEHGQAIHRLSIPNREVRLVYAHSFQKWMERRMRGHGGSLEALTGALLTGDAVGVQRELGAFARDLLSYHDTGGLRPENMYQGFVIGLLAVMEDTHLVRSNRESGAGRPDVMIRPRRPGAPGAVLELKVARPGEKTLDAALDEGLAQLAAKDYAAELRAVGAEPVHGFAVAFDGKEVRVRSAPAVVPPQA